MTEPEGLERARDLIERHGVHTVECMFPDTWGIPRGKRIPAKRFLHGGGFQIANVSLTWDVHCLIFPTGFVDDSTGYPDMRAVPDLSTLSLAGWREGTASCICDAFDLRTGEPVTLAGRELLRRAAARLQDEGYEPNVATELEFHVCTPEWEPVYRGVYCYSIAKGAELEDVLGEIRAVLEISGMEVEAWNVEYGPAQVEVNLAPGTALAVADRTMLFKYVVKEVARRHGLRATFMAKPFAAEAGNGLHIHQSLRGSDGKNAFAAADAEPPVRSRLMRRYLTGLVAHHAELQAVMSPTINAYKRVEDYSFAPTQVSWGLDHRLVGVRCIAAAGEATRLEARWASADANPYLVLAGCLGAGADGLAHELELPPMVTGDPHRDAHLERLATSLDRAVPAFAGSAFARGLFGDVFVDTYATMLRHEIETFERVVTDWELERYREVM